MIDRRLLAPCGLYCGVCAVYMAHRDGNLKLKEILANKVYGCGVEDLSCLGCKSDQRSAFCGVCHIRDCTETKGFEGCHQCEEWPCEHIRSFPVEVGKKVIMRAVPQWREMGTEAWVSAEEKRYICPECGYKLFRGVKSCRQCKTPVDLD